MTHSASSLRSLLCRYGLGVFFRLDFYGARIGSKLTTVFAYHPLTVLATTASLISCTGRLRTGRWQLLPPAERCNFSGCSLRYLVTTLTSWPELRFRACKSTAHQDRTNLAACLGSQLFPNVAGAWPYFAAESDSHSAAACFHREASLTLRRQQQHHGKPYRSNYCVQSYVLHGSFLAKSAVLDSRLFTYHGSLSVHFL